MRNINQRLRRNAVDGFTFPAVRVAVIVAGEDASAAVSGW